MVERGSFGPFVTGKGWVKRKKHLSDPRRLSTSMLTILSAASLFTGGR
ncbi:hypothetical protein GPLA_3994 [Paraglaciecola polaris LMG 21857]|uniref:Uncharacterized protein n=1 Tax=Paraglaciecola polaris LMG 21857 TaxID=1129793 RepID=K7A1R9_9ALTE|nr:hypothetical protein GPLA_3994 [Paraglaciecola polaris LMG 21857]